MREIKAAQSHLAFARCRAALFAVLFAAFDPLALCQLRPKCRPEFVFVSWPSFPIAEVFRLEPVFFRPRVHPALRSFGRECEAVFVRLLAYFGGMLTLAAIVSGLSSKAPDIVAFQAEPAPETWTQVHRPYPAFSVVASDFVGKTETYSILRHPRGGRRDLMRWSDGEGVPAAGLAFYRPGTEDEVRDAASEAAFADIATVRPGSLQPIGLIESKFGAIQLFGLTETSSGAARQCVAFLKSFAEPQLRFSGLFCSGDTGASVRSQIVCVVNRLNLLSAGGDPRLADLFAKAELKGRECKGQRGPGDWISAMADPGLRGRL